MLRQRSSQLQKYKAAHSKSKTHNATMGTQIKNMAGRMSRRIAVERRRYAAWIADTQG